MAWGGMEEMIHNDPRGAEFLPNGSVEQLKKRRCPAGKEEKMEGQEEGWARGGKLPDAEVGDSST